MLCSAGSICAWARRLLCHLLGKKVRLLPQSHSCSCPKGVDAQTADSANAAEPWLPAQQKRQTTSQYWKFYRSNLKQAEVHGWPKPCEKLSPGTRAFEHPTVTHNHFASAKSPVYVKHLLHYSQRAWNSCFKPISAANPRCKI